MYLSVFLFLYSRIVFVMFLVLNITFWSLNSSAAVPVTTILAILGLWLGISLPLTFVGAFLGYRKGVSLILIPVLCFYR